MVTYIFEVNVFTKYAKHEHNTVFGLNPDAFLRIVTNGDVAALEQV